MGVASVISGPEPRSGRAAGKVVHVLVVDDSITARAVFSRVIKRSGDLELAALAGTAEEALRLLDTVRVDVIMLDLDMPGMGGLDALPQLIEKSTAQVLVVSSLTVEGAEHTMQALSQGAADTMPKPRPGCFDNEYCDSLLEKIRALGGVPASESTAKRAENLRPALAFRKASSKAAEVLAIGASTGGIHAMGQLLDALPGRLGIPILVTQHLPGSFMDAFARQLERSSGLKAVLAQEGMIPVADQIMIAPGHGHMMIVEDKGVFRVRLDDTPVASGCMPSVDPMFSSLAEIYGARTMGVLLSGMGRDGTIGAREIVDAGGTIMAQDAPTCAVWGMPGSVATAGLASEVLPPEQLAEKIAINRGII